MRLLEQRFDQQVSTNVSAAVVGQILVDVAAKDVKFASILTKIKRAYDDLLRNQ